MSNIQFGQTRNLILPKASEQMRWGYLTYDTSLGDVTENLKYQVGQGTALVPQSIIVNTQAVTDAVDITWDVGGVNFSFSVPPNVLQMFTVPAVDPPIFSIAPGAGSTGILRIDMLNFPAVPENFMAINQAIGQNVFVTNPAATPVLTSLLMGGNPVSLANPLFSEISQAGAAVTAANPLYSALSEAGVVVSATNPLSVKEIPTAATLVTESLTPAAGANALTAPPANVNVRRLRLSISGDATLAAAGENAIQLSQSGVVIFDETIYMPATALDTAGLLWSADVDLSDVTFNTGGSPTLSLDVTTAFATGKFNINAYYD